jgi:prepilin-type N-terminal cleavage/methylation domain-containing protein
MAYQNKYKNIKNIFSFINSNGFSLIELIVVIGISLLIFNVSSSGFNSFKTHSNLEITVSGVVEGIRLAQSSALSGKRDMKWGVKILPNEMIVFGGNDYQNRDTSLDEYFSFSNDIVLSGVSEIVFEKISGKTINGGDIFISNSSGEKKYL